MPTISYSLISHVLYQTCLQGSVVNPPSSVPCAVLILCFLGDLPWRLPSILKPSQDYAASEVCLSILGFSFQFYPSPMNVWLVKGVISLSLGARKGKQPKRLQETQEKDWFWLEEFFFSQADYGCQRQKFQMSMWYIICCYYHSTIAERKRLLNIIHKITFSKEIGIIT